MSVTAYSGSGQTVLLATRPWPGSAQGEAYSVRLSAGSALGTAAQGETAPASL